MPKKSNKDDVQLNLLEAFKKADEGIKRATDSANKREPGWPDKAYAFFVQWLYLQPAGKIFMVEDVRLAASESRYGDMLPLPPSNRAWGGIVRRAVKDKLVTHAGHSKTANVKAHGTPASLWKKN